MNKKAAFLLFVCILMLATIAIAIATPPPPMNEVSVSVDPTQQNGAPGDILIFNVTVTNNGTVPDIIVVDSITGIPAGWTVELKDDETIVSLPYTTALLQSHTSYNLSLDVRIPGDAASTTESMCIEIYSYANFTERDNATFWCIVKSTSFDTGNGTYPSIMGTHTGTIKPGHDVFVRRMFMYPCTGTGGHSEYVKIWNATWNATATWNGYAGDWHNISFGKTVFLMANETYNYTIRTGSYPQIIHESPFNATGGAITCDKFIDANGRIYYDWIPAFRLFL